MAWLGTTVTFSLVITVSYWIYKEVHQRGMEPKFQLENPKIEHNDIGTAGENKSLYFDIRNKGKGEAQNCRLDIKVKGVWGDFASNGDVFNINPLDKKTILLCQPSKKPNVVLIKTQPQKYPLLDKGKIYELELQIKGKNVTEEKIHKLRLDLSSWEGIKIKLDC